MGNKYSQIKSSFKLKSFLSRILLFILLFFFIFNLFSPLGLYAANAKDFVKDNYARASMDENGNIYIRENLHSKIHPASLTKIAISILAIEKLKLKEKVVIEEIDYVLPLDYVTTPLYIGETLTVEDLLYATMLKSGNDAAIYLAKHIFGDEKSFVEDINKYLKNLGLLNTHFTNSFGLEDDNHYTTPYDLLLLSKHAMKNKTFKDIVSKDKYIIQSNSFSDERVMKTTSLFTDKNSSVFNKNFYGIKSGYTEKAGDCFIAATKIFDKEFYFIYTGANSRVSKFIKIQNMYDDTKYILEKKTYIDQYAKASIDIQNSKYSNLNYLHSKYFFTNFDKLVFSLFGIIIFVLSFKLILIKKRKRKR